MEDERLAASRHPEGSTPPAGLSQKTTKPPAVLYALLGYAVTIVTVPLGMMAFMGPATFIETDYAFLRHLIFSPVPLLLTVALYRTLRQRNANPIRWIRILLVLESVRIGIAELYRHLYYPSIAVGIDPRNQLPGYTAILVMGAATLLFTIVWIGLISLPSVGRWRKAHDSSKPTGNRSQPSHIERHPIKLVWTALGSVPLILAGILASKIGHRIPPPDRMSFETLQQHASQQETPLLRLRGNLMTWLIHNAIEFPITSHSKLPPLKASDYRYEAVVALPRFGEQALPILLSALEDPDVTIRTAAAHSIGQIKTPSPEARQRLLEHLRAPPNTKTASSPRLTAPLPTPIERLRPAAALALIRLYPQDPAIRQAILEGFESTTQPDLLTLIEDLILASDLPLETSPLVIQHLLAEATDPFCFYLLRCLRSLELRPRHASLNIPWTPTLINLLNERLQHSEPLIQRESLLLLSLTETVTPETVASVASLLRSPQVEVQMAACRAISRWAGTVNNRLISGLIDIVQAPGPKLELLSEADYWLAESKRDIRPNSRSMPMVQHADADTLHELGMAFSRVRPTLSFFNILSKKIATLATPTPQRFITLRRMAIRALGTLGSHAAAAVPHLRTWSEDSTAPERWEATLALRAITRENDSFLTSIEALLPKHVDVPREDIRFDLLHETLLVLQEIGPQAVPAITTLFTVKDPTLRLKVYDYLERQARHHPAAQPILKQAVNDPFTVIRTRARKLNPPEPQLIKKRLPGLF